MIDFKMPPTWRELELIIERVGRIEDENVGTNMSLQKLIERVEVLKAKTRDGREAPMGDTVDEMLGRDEFRGLWRKRRLDKDGYIVDGGWSVAFIHEGEQCETPDQASACGACAYAMDVLQKAGPFHVQASDPD